MLCDQYYLTSPELKLTQVNGKIRAYQYPKLSQKSPNSVTLVHIPVDLAWGSSPSIFYYRHLI